MRIAVVHSFYSTARADGGENLAVLDQAEALAKRGHEVALVSRRTDELSQTAHYAVRSAVRVATGLGYSPLKALEDFGPDVVHVHNLFPNFGKRWVSRWSGPVVTTLHNYRPMCAAGTQLRDDLHCEDCLGRLPLPAVQHGCYRGSRLATIPVAVGGMRGASRDALLSHADKIVVLTDRMKSAYQSAGIADRKMRVVPNFLPDERVPDPESHARSGWLYVGRLEPEKGIARLVDKWPASEDLRIVGGGSQLDELQGRERRNVHVLGRRDRTEVLDQMRRSTGLLVPSLWLEGLPLVYVEALASGLPVLAMETNVVADLVRREGTGQAATWDENLAEILPAARDRLKHLSADCYGVFKRKYSEAAVMQQLEDVFGEVAARLR